MKRKFAYLIMGPSYDPDTHTAAFETERQITCIFTVRDFEEAKERALRCAREGFGVIEVCGAFGEARVRELVELTDGAMGVGYVIHLPEQQPVFDAFFGK